MHGGEAKIYNMQALHNSVSAVVLFSCHLGRVAARLASDMQK